jgi:exopolyphosphatase / guanosine-5'-triphosphate,3'-diphosphate pyrophosphatase
MLHIRGGYVNHMIDRATLTEKLAIIDVGSNSFRLIVMSYTPGLHYQLTDEVRESVRLVHNLGATGQLSKEAMDRAVEAMHMYRQFCVAMNIPDEAIFAVATSAVRDAANQAQFLARVAKEAQLKVRVLSEKEEAYYGYLAAVNSTPLENGYVVDIGGGSMQISHVVDRLHRASVSFPLGAVRVTEDWLPEAPTPQEAVNALRHHIRRLLEPLDWFKAKKSDRLVVLGGSVRNVARMIQKMQGYSMDELHGYQTNKAALRKVIRALQSLSVQERRRLPGMKEDRADITLAAALVLETCIDFSDHDEMIVCGQGVREGLFYSRYVPEPPHLFEDIRRQSILNIANLYGYQENHAQHVADLCLSMFDQLQNLLDTPFSAADRHLLWAASILHDIGMRVDYNDHHKHSYYLILNSGLPGYEHREIALIALLAKYHRKGTPDAGELADVLANGDRVRLLRLTALLRLAEQIDRSRDGSVYRVRLSRVENALQLTLISNLDVTVSVRSAQSHTNIFQEAFGVPLHITALIDPETLKG